MKCRFGKCLVVIALVYLTVVPAGASQGIAPDVEREINTQVWIPILAASNSFDAEGFLAVQSPDLVRVSVDTKDIYGLDRCATEIRAGFGRAKERALKRTSEMRFLTRTQSGALAHETGIFKSEVVLPSGERRTRYTRFEMILRKEAGLWKILVDKDTSQNGTITEEEYRAAAPLRAS